MRITFKNVGQGDSIILEWKKNNIEQIAIIDCHRYNNTNPILDYIQSQNIKEISFIILSHPHRDHFSGLLELFDYCQKNEVIIRLFGHTFTVTPIYVLQWAEIEQESKKMLRKIHDKAIELKNTGIIKELGTITKNWTISLNSNFNLRALSPSELENRLYLRYWNQFKEVNEKKCSQLANLLSTFIKIYNPDAFILLTADTEIVSLDRIEELEEFEGELLLGQVPHHGSIKNHKISFWENFSKEADTPIIISAGEHKRYNHPDEQVVMDFVNHQFKVYATNAINGISSFIAKLEDISLMSKLDDESEVVDLQTVVGDQIFEVENNKLRYVS